MANMRHERFSNKICRTCYQHIVLSRFRTERYSVSGPIAQSVEPSYGTPRFPGLSSGQTVHLSHPVTNIIKMSC
jgi:hypothetical protein